MRPPVFFVSRRRFHRPSSILFSSRAPLFPPALAPGPFRSAVRPFPPEKSPQRTAAPSSAGTKKPLCGRFGPPTRSPLEWNSI